MPSTMVYVAASAIALAGGACYLSSRRKPSNLTGALRGGRWKPVKLQLISKNPLTRDTVLFKFALPDKNEVLGLPVGQHLLFKHNSYRRPYTPISTPDAVGTLDLAVKVYKPNSSFPKGGGMSQALAALDIGSEIVAFGPYGQLEYLGSPGKFEISRKGSRKEFAVKQLHLVAGGTGITPMFQMIQTILSSDDSVTINLYFANKTLDDVILRDSLDKLQEKYPTQLFITYVVTRQAKPGGFADSKYFFGKLDAHFLRDRLSGCVGRDDCLIGICGPPKLSKETCMPTLNSMGVENDRIYSF